jgi:acyl-CoA thioester hydrolase
MIEVGDSHLLVEMLMFDEPAENLKAIMWTKFTSVSVKTGRREPHSAEFMDFARTTLTPGRDAQGGLRARVEELMKR